MPANTSVDNNAISYILDLYNKLSTKIKKIDPDVEIKIDHKIETCTYYIGVKSQELFGILEEEYPRNSNNEPGYFAEMQISPKKNNYEVSIKLNFGFGNINTKTLFEAEMYSHFQQDVDHSDKIWGGPKMFSGYIISSQTTSGLTKINFERLVMVYYQQYRVIGLS